MNETANGRGQWQSRMGFILASAGSAVGLGNLWRFPYITGENGGGLFVLIYLGCIALIGFPVMVAEIMVGRGTQRSNVEAYRTIAGQRTPWQGLGWLGVAVAFLILSFYSVVAGWALRYTLLAVTGQLSQRPAEEIGDLFGATYASVPLNLIWTGLFVALTVSVVWRGVQHGLERWSRLLMPALLVLLLILLGRAVTLDGFGEAFGFVFGIHADALSGAGVMEAMGHSFFTLSLGMGGVLTYGSYLKRDADIPALSGAIAGLDTLIALLACLVIFPVTFTYGLETTQGPGLLFASIPIAISQMPASTLLASVFFFLLVFAALTSSIALLEVTTAHFIDVNRWSRTKSALVSGLIVAALAIPCALTGATDLFGAGFAEMFGKNWFDTVADFVSNWTLPVGGMGIALFVAWKMPERLRQEQFTTGSRLAGFYASWLVVLRFVVPLAIIAVFLRAVGLF